MFSGGELFFPQRILRTHNHRKWGAAKYPEIELISRNNSFRFCVSDGINVRPRSGRVSQFNWNQPAAGAESAVWLPAGSRDLKLFPPLHTTAAEIWIPYFLLWKSVCVCDRLRDTHTVQVCLISTSVFQTLFVPLVATENLGTIELTVLDGAVIFRFLKWTKPRQKSYFL